MDPKLWMLMFCVLPVLLSGVSCQGSTSTSTSRPGLDCEGQFSCLEECIPLSKKCDGVIDCVDVSDELSCFNQTCLGNQFHCDDLSKCIPQSLVCTGIWDCEDGSDEKSCERQLSCPSGEWSCPTSNAKCIPLGRLCDGNEDCPGGKDEQIPCSNLRCGLLSCAHDCTSAPGGGLCTCPRGYKLANDSRSCEDLDECTSFGYCHQLCTNSEGSYECSCAEGYTQNRGRCSSPSTDSAYLIYAQSRDIYKTASLTDMTPTKLTTSHWVYAMDYHWRKQQIYWGDVLEDTVYSAPLTGGDRTRLGILGLTHDVVSLAVDWINDKLYTAEYVSNTISVAELNGTNRAPVVSLESRISALAVDPTEGYLFYAMATENARIVRAYMDGSHREDLVTDFIFFVHDMVVDIPAKRIYWVDSMLDYLESVQYDGRSRQIITIGFQFLPHPAGLAVFNEFAFATDQTKLGVIKMNRFDRNPQATEVIHSTSRQISRLKVIHPTLQPAGTSPCGTDNGGCSHLCLLSHRTDSDGLGYRCNCPFGMQLGSNEKSCTAIQNILLYNTFWSIRGVSLDSDSQNEAISPITSYFLSKPFTVDVSGRRLFIETDNLFVVTFDGTGHQYLTLGNAVTLTSLSYDWLAGNLYSFGTVDYRLGIYVTRPDSDWKGHRMLLDGFTYGGHVKVAPLAGYLFWTETQPRIAKIERGWMDGSHRTVIVNTLLGSPEDIAVDNAENKLYWLDSVLRRIERINFDGTGRILLDVQQLGTPSGLALYGEYLLYSDSRIGGIVRVNKADGSGHEVQYRIDTPVFYLDVVTENSQPGSNTCSVSGGLCSHFCFAIPNNGRVCGCPYGMKLDDDNRECVDDPDEEATGGCPDRTFSCDGDKCLPSWYRCDGQTHCQDNSDEEGCETCSYSAFSCDGGCLPYSLRCNHNVDCEDGSDEENCFRGSCPEERFECANGNCIPPHNKCDTINHCGDSSDEVNCEAHVCEDGMFSCVNHLKCVPAGVVCDGWPNCGDGSDEVDCGEIECTAARNRWQCGSGECIVADNVCDQFWDCNDQSDEFNCTVLDPGECQDDQFLCELDQQCIPVGWHCDGHHDCSDFSDENGCRRCGEDYGAAPVTCPAEFFQCDNNLCIETYRVCNGRHDCGDGSDEDECTPPPFTCDADEYQCYGEEQCIADDLVCNNEQDCPDGDDEGLLCNSDSCETENGGCSQTCVQTPFGAKCECESGFRLNGTKVCQDIDECATLGRCSQTCENSPGGYRCFCAEGYTKIAGGRCVHTDPTHPTLLVTTQRRMARIDLETGRRRYLVYWDNPLGIGSHIQDEIIFWSDKRDNAIYSFNGTHHNEILSGGVDITESIAVDWVSRKIYWMDFIVQAIEVANMDGSDRMFLVTENVTNPRGLAVDPRDGKHFLFWTDWSQNARIERIDMDGKNRIKIVTEDLYWVNGLTLDLPAERVYYADARMDYIASCNYDGSNVRRLDVMALVGSHVHSLTVFEDYLYWSDRTSNKVMRTDKFGGQNASYFANIYGVWNVKARHPVLQPNATNNCENNPCQHLCLLSTTAPFYSCNCPVGLVLNSDGTTCIDGGPSILFSKKNAIWSTFLDSNHTVYSTVPVVSLNRAFDVDFDLQDGQIYWTESTDDSETDPLHNREIQRVLMIGSNRSDFVPSAFYGTPHSIAVDWVTRNMFWSNSMRNSIEVIKMDGEIHHRTTIISSNALVDIGDPVSMCVDPVNGKIFWADEGGIGVQRHIASCSMDGTNYRKIVTDRLSSLGSVVVDIEDQRIYWSERSHQVVESSDVNGGDRRTVVSGLHDPRGITLHGSHLYIVDANLQQVIRVDKNTGGDRIVYRHNMRRVKTAKVMVRPNATNSACSNNGGCAHLCLPTGPGSRACKCSMGYQLDSNGKTCSNVTSFLLVAQLHVIRGFTLDTNDHHDAMVPVGGPRYVLSADPLPRQQKVYFVERGNSVQSAIRQVSPSGGSIETIISGGIGQNGIRGMIIDWVAGNLYWSNAFALHTYIEVGRLNGTHRRILYRTEDQLPRALAINPIKRYLYFADYGNNPHIGRLDLSGQNHTTMARMGVQISVDLSIDLATHHVYWTDVQAGTIERVDWDGRNRLLIRSNLANPFGITVFEQKVFWVDRTVKKVYSIDKNANPNTEPTVLKEDMRQLRDVVMYDVRAKPDIPDHPCRSESYGGCEQLCFARPAGLEPTYICGCSFGTLSSDGRTCQKSDKFLVYGTSTTIKSHSFDADDHSQSIRPIGGLRYVTSVDFDYERDQMYFKNQGGIQVARPHDASQTTQSVPAYRVSYSSRLRIDRIHRRLYWSSYTSLRYRHLDSGLASQGNIAIYTGYIYQNLFEIAPCQGFIFYLGTASRYSWRERGLIRMNLMGGQARVIRPISTYCFFTLDSAESMVYTACRSSSTLERCDYDGNNVRVLSETFLGQYIVISGDYLFTYYYTMAGILRMEKDTMTGYSLVTSQKGEWLRFLTVYENRVEQCSGSACDVSNGGCSHNCTRGPDSQALCSCPQRYLRLVNNGRMCMGPPASTCNSGEFTCANGNCVPMEFACDIDDDCGDGTDEDDTFCFDHQCDPSEFTCANGRCIHPGFLCDYNNDCRDNSDEVECEFRTCDADVDFTCTNSRCISLDKVCDTNDDCGDPTASDEQNCEDPEPCQTDYVRCPYNNICIYKTFVCDGDNDCTDNSDENQLYCAIQPCEAPYWRCPSGRCIPGAWQCDGDDDCGDEADEPDTCGTADHVCVEGFFTCGNGHCIPTTWICDTDDDCGDGSDEHEDLNCDDHSCSEDFFTCLQNKPGRSRCIPTEWLCDGDSDCETAEDEADCERGTCAAGQFSCDNGLCINGDWECDHDNDCGDASDEGIDCEYQTCSAEDQFSCTNGRCIPIGWECDDEDDCRDGSDEMDELCNAPGPTCPPNHFRCTSGQCIPYESACNKVNDCDDESDELHCNIDECASVVSNQCESSCVNTLTSFRCTCADGYVLNADQKTCRDIDECTETPWMCSQLCENLPGSYFCKCAEGYLQVEDSPGSCKHTSDEVPFLVFSNRYYIRRLTVDASEYDLIADDFGLALTMDYDYRDRKLYVVDTYGELVQMNLDGTDRKVILTDNIRGGEGIAVDWVTRKLYFINRYRKRLEVFELDGRYRRTLVFEGMFQPRGLVVDPKHGTLYWTDWGIDAYIGKLGMDGSDAGGKIRDDKIVWPNGLTIDFPSEKLFWCDAHLDFIAYSDLDGSNMHELPGQPGAEVAHPFGLDVFEDWVYWTDWNVKGVFKAKKFSGEEQQLLVSSEHRPFDIRVVHSSLHANMTNPCGENNGGCSHLCLIALNGTTSTCACPDGFLLQSDGVTCYPNCSVQEYRCLDNSKCIPFYWKCDGSEDCADGSDELDSCPERHCDSRRFQCTNQNCTSSVQLCNGQDDCGDNSDEAHCQATTCRDWEFRCNTGNCILHRLVCNRNNNCPDGSDEDAEVCAATECTKGYFKCNNGFCIPESWICDFDDDCGDGSDEIHRECQSVTCPTGWFSCRTNYRCVPSWAVCNSRDNCRDNSDEENCETTECENGEFRCDNHKCIPIRWQCDFEDDCGDGSDEVACTYRECSESEYRCPNDQCIPGRWVCNHRDDCKSAADESSCENHECPSDQFQCASGHCVHEDYRCDGDWDCDDISDEQDCPTRLPGGRYCYASEFTCTNHLCIPRSYQCDGFNDCGDESDESVELCAKNMCDAETHFHCTNQKCLPNWMVCDGFNDCLDGSDENTHKLCDDLLVCTDEEYRCGNGNCINNIDVCDAYDDCGDQSDEVGCQIGGSCSEADCHQECTDITGGGYLCSCSKGYRRNPLDSRCLDIDECQEDNPCVQQCKNTKGGVHCSCITGYVDHEHGDGMGCKADEENRPQMLFSDGDGMRYLDTGTHDYDDVVSNEGRIQAVDVNTMTGAVYWTDSTFRVIKRVRLPFFSSTPSKPEIIVNQYQTDRPVGIAVDWIGSNIYWTDQGVESAALTRARRDVDLPGYDGPRISVGKTDGRYLRVLIKEDMESVGVIAINPRRGLMYWTQAGDNPRIEMAWMDGTHRQTLTTEVVKPTGLVIDFTRNDTVYFCDEKRDMISSMGWDGSGRKVVSQGLLLRNPFQLEVFETNLYWTTRDATPGSIWLNSVLTMNKLGKGVPVIVLDHLANPSGLKLYHKLRYSLQDSNACAESPCSHLCLATPTSYDSSPLNGFTCACPQGDTFEIDSIFNCQGAIVEANTMSPLVNPNCQCANGGTCLFDGSCLCFNEWSGPNCTLSSMQRRKGGAGAAVGVTFFVLVMIALAVVAVFYFMRNMRAKKPEDQIPVAYKEGTTNVDLPLGNVDDPHKDVNGTDLGGNFENPMYGLQTAELQAVGHDDNANNAGPLPEKTGLPPDVVQASPVPPPSKPGEVVVDLPLPAPDSSGPMEEEYRRAAFSPTEEEGDTNMLVTRDEM